MLRPEYKHSVAT